MSTSPPSRPPAGWYRDPYDATKQRYWDGAEWTEHVAPGVVGRPDPFAMVPPELLVQREAAAGPWARAGFVVLAAATCGSTVSSIGQLSDGKRAFAQFNAGQGIGSFGAGSAGWAVLGTAAGFVALLANVALLLWMLRASQASHRLGIPAVRSAGWAAAGFLVPVVSLWFPYQGMRDLFLPGDPHREVAKRWWALHIAGSVLAIAFAGAYFWSTAVAAVLAGLAVMATVGAAMTAYPLVHDALDHHTRIVAAPSN